MTTNRASTAYHPYGQYATSEDELAQPLASHYSSAPLLDIPLTHPENVHGWQSASMPTFGNLQRLSDSSHATSATGNGMTDGEEEESDSDSQNSRDPFRLSAYARSTTSNEDIYMQARSGSEGRTIGRPIPRPISVQSVLTNSREPSIRAVSPYTDGQSSIQTYATARGGYRDSVSDHSNYSQSEDDHDNGGATFHVGIEGQRVELTDQRTQSPTLLVPQFSQQRKVLRNPFRDSGASTGTGSSSETERAGSQVYSSHLLPRSRSRGEMEPRDARTQRTERAGSGLSYSSTGTSILDFQADYPSSSPTPPFR